MGETNKLNMDNSLLTFANVIYSSNTSGGYTGINANNAMFFLFIRNQ